MNDETSNAQPTTSEPTVTVTEPNFPPIVPELTLKPVEKTRVKKGPVAHSYLALGLHRLAVGQAITVPAGQKTGMTAARKDPVIGEWAFRVKKNADGTTTIWRTEPKLSARGARGPRNKPVVATA